ncbi:hypothetical protein [Shewanella sp. ALD9]|uniref:hypothetical protein n=1 Tax=Shewanella sp. ALD9 TaxID=2058330 RepID=UPI000C344DCA|nr:hypothetical protein [Shewanella sp. ALD9]PKH33917.1 hypothetical protein CXF88_07525 [Shewanella sp. ALD9]
MLNEDGPFSVTFILKIAQDIADDKKTGKLVPKLTECVGESVALNLICPGRENITQVMLLLRDKLRQYCP